MMFRSFSQAKKISFVLNNRIKLTSNYEYILFSFKCSVYVTLLLWAYIYNCVFKYKRDYHFFIRWMHFGELFHNHFFSFSYIKMCSSYIININFITWEIYLYFIKQIYFCLVIFAFFCLFVFHILIQILINELLFFLVFTETK